MKLQKPAYVCRNGRLIPWDEATIHVGCEAAIRGLNVFEGVKGYRQPDGSIGVVMLRQHYERLKRSARLLYLPFEYSFDEFREAICSLIEALLEPGNEMWLRTTLFAVDGHWGEDTATDLIVTGYQVEPATPKPIHVGVSTWHRSADISLPARIKTGSNYQVGRLARIEGRRNGWQDMVLLNEAGRVAECTGSCLLMVRNGVVVTPPATEGALESITIDIVEALARSMGIGFIRRPIDRTELVVADELALCGTLAELVAIQSIDGLPLPAQSPLLSALQTRYFDAVRSVVPHLFVELTECAVPAEAGSTEGTDHLPR